MKKMFVILALILLVSTVTVMAQSAGPTITDASEKILSVTEDGRWFARDGWWLRGVTPGSTVKAEIIDGNNKVVAWTSWTTEDKDNNWCAASHDTKRWPSNDYETLYRFTPGNYTLNITSNGNSLWKTPFTVNNVKIKGEDNFRISGPWKEMMYCFAGKGSSGLVVVFWIEGPADLSWHDPSNYDRRFNLTAEVKRNGVVIMHEEEDGEAPLYIKPGSASKGVRNIGHESSVKEKMLSQDGDYEITVYGNLTHDKWIPIARMIVPVKGGKISPNPGYPQYNTSNSYYNKNLITEKLPPQPK